MTLLHTSPKLKIARVNAIYAIVLHIYLSQYGYLTIKMSRTKKAHNAN